MKKILFVFVLVATIACEDVDEFEDWDGGVDAGDCSNQDPECFDGEMTCNGDVVVSCKNGVWAFEENCLAGQGVCISDGHFADCLYPD